MLTAEARDRSEAETRTPRGRLAPILLLGLVCLVFVPIALVSTSIVHWGTSSAARGTLGGSTQAFFIRPLVVDQGVKSGSNIALAIAPPSSGVVAWTDRCPGRAEFLGDTDAKSTAPVVVSIATSHCARRSWLTISVSGVPVPLKAWIS